MRIFDQWIDEGNGLFMNVRSWYLLFTAKGYTVAVLGEVSPFPLRPKVTLWSDPVILISILWPKGHLRESGSDIPSSIKELSNSVTL